MQNSNYYRFIETYTAGCEMIWVQTSTPILTLLDIFTRTENDRLSFNEVIRILKKLNTQVPEQKRRFIEAIEPDIRRIQELPISPVCIFCQSLFSSERRPIPHEDLMHFEHIAFHSGDYADTDSEIFDDKSDAIDFDSTEVVIAKPGIKGSWDGDQYQATDWIEVAKHESLWAVDCQLHYLLSELQISEFSTEVNDTSPCDCSSGPAVFFLVNYVDQVVLLGEVSEETKSFDELEELIANDTGWETLGEFALKKWQSLASPREDWNRSQIIWAGCVECAKPLVDPHDNDAGELLLALALDELNSEIESDLLTRFETALIAIVRNEFLLTTWASEIYFDAIHFKSAIHNLPAPIKNRIPNLIAALEETS